MIIPVTEYRRPNGQKIERTYQASSSLVYEKAYSLIQQGYHFTLENLGNGMVAFTISDDNEDLTTIVSVNGLTAPASFEQMILNFKDRIQ